MTVCRSGMENITVTSENVSRNRTAEGSTRRGARNMISRAAMFPAYVVLLKWGF